MNQQSTQRKPVIGLLGGIGSGKSTVARAFQARGCGVIDADLQAKEALEEPDTVRQLVAWWGRDVLGPDGRPDRAKIAKRVFADPAELARLEGLIHPRVAQKRGEVTEKLQNAPEIIAIVEDCPLLLEKKLEGPCDALVFVDAPDAARFERVARTRGWAREEWAMRESRQMPLDIKRARADYVIRNDGVSDIALQVSEILGRLLRPKHGP